MDLIDYIIDALLDLKEVYAMALRDSTYRVAIFAVIGAFVASYMSVLIHRLPKMMKEDALAQAFDYYPDLFNRDMVCISTDANSGTDLVKRSTTPCCNSLISWYNNVPVLAYLRLRGKCDECGATISRRYIALELFGALCFAVLATIITDPIQLSLVLATTSIMVTISVIDAEHKIIPDGLIAALLMVLLLGINERVIQIDLSDAILSAIVVYTILIGINALFRQRGHNAIGEGDIKLLAVLAVAIGVQNTLLSLMLALLLALIVSRFRGRTGEQALAMYICLCVTCPLLLHI